MYAETFQELKGLMVKPSKNKLCWNCEGSVSLQEENCPYCGVYLSPSDEDLIEEDVNDLFSPPYSLEEEAEERLSSVPASPYGHEEEETHAESVGEVAKKMRSSADDVKRVIIPLTLLLSGTVFFLFGLALFLFSRKNVFILQWNGAYWHFYLMFGVFALVVGWRALSRVEEVE